MFLASHIALASLNLARLGVEIWTNLAGGGFMAIPLADCLILEYAFVVSDILIQYGIRSIFFILSK